MAWNNHQRLWVILGYFGRTFSSFLVHTLNLVGRVTWSTTTPLGRLIERFQMTSRRQFWCCKAVLWELTSFLKQPNSFVPVNLQGCRSREWKFSICNDWELRQPLELPRPKKKSLKADYQSKRCTMTVPAEALAFESHENISYQFAYLRSNVHGLESHWGKIQLI